MTHTAKHTPGPWTFEKNSTTSHTFVIYGSFNQAGDGMRLAEVWSGPAQLTEPKYGCPEFIDTQGEANAKLIAAAPDMAEVLGECQWLLRNLHAQTHKPNVQAGIRDVGEKISAALAKAGV